MKVRQSVPLYVVVICGTRQLDELVLRVGFSRRIMLQLPRRQALGRLGIEVRKVATTRCALGGRHGMIGDTPARSLLTDLVHLLFLILW